MKYSIEEQTLTDIGDALRRKHGETKTVTVMEEQLIPASTISKTPNAIGFDSFEGEYSGLELNDYGWYNHTVYIPNAAKIKMKVSWDFAHVDSSNYDEFCITKGQSWGEYVSILTTWKDGSGEYEVEGEYVTFTIKLKDGSHTNLRNKLGYYAECSGYDVDGNPLEEKTVEVAVEKELPNTYSSADMAQAIDDIEIGESLPDSALVLTGACNYKFANGGWDWFLDMYGDKITTQNISNASYMFNNSTITDIPFELNLANGCNMQNVLYNCSNLKEIPKLNFPENQTSYNAFDSAFYGCKSIKEIDTIKNVYLGNYESMFSGCYNLRYPPKFENINWNRVHTNSISGGRSLFSSCYSLREYPQEILDNHWGIWTSYLYPLFYYMCNSCYVLNEVKGANPVTGTISSAVSLFGYSFNYASRLKDFTFAIQEDGTPYTAKWKGATMDFTQYTGWCSVDKRSYILNYNSGITADKEVTDDATYQALKDDVDWFTCDLAYSRYNHDSAVNTINSLPDTSAYGTNTIKFKGDAGSATDGGAINTLTAEEIAVATAKGWTVTLA